MQNKPHQGDIFSSDINEYLPAERVHNEIDVGNKKEKEKGRKTELGDGMNNGSHSNVVNRDNEEEDTESQQKCE
jgi:hypothetical protein